MGMPFFEPHPSHAPTSSPTLTPGAAAHNSASAQQQQGAGGGGGGSKDKGGCKVGIAEPLPAVPTVPTFSFNLWSMGGEQHADNWASTFALCRSMPDTPVHAPAPTPLLAVKKGQQQAGQQGGSAPTASSSAESLGGPFSASAPSSAPPALHAVSQEGGTSSISVEAGAGAGGGGGGSVQPALPVLVVTQLPVKRLVGPPLIKDPEVSCMTASCLCSCPSKPDRAHPCTPSCLILKPVLGTPHLRPGVTCLTASFPAPNHTESTVNTLCTCIPGWPGHPSPCMSCPAAWSESLCTPNRCLPLCLTSLPRWFICCSPA